MYTRDEQRRFPFSIRDKRRARRLPSAFRGCSRGGGGGWRRLRMRDGRSKTATDNKSYDDTFYRSIGVSVPLEKEDPGEKARASSREITSAGWERGCLVLARRQSITLGTYYPPTPPPLNHTRPFHAPPNTIHLPYPRPLAPSASRHADDLSPLAKLYFYVAFFLRSPPYSAVPDFPRLSGWILFLIVDRYWGNVSCLYFAGRAERVIENFERNQSFSNIIIFVIMWSSELENFECV